MQSTKLQPLQEAVDLDGYLWLTTNAPFYVDAALLALQRGATPEEIKRFVSTQVGVDRQGIAIRVEQCARHLARTRSGQLIEVGS